MMMMMMMMMMNDGIFQGLANLKLSQYDTTADLADHHDTAM